MKRVALLLALAVAACGEPPPPAPHIVLVACDGLRPDHLELHGYTRETAPRLLAWAQGALVFDNALAPSPDVRASVLSLFTGRHPGPDRTLPAGERLPQDAAVLPELLAAAGYATAAVSGQPLVSSALGADRGFEDFVDAGWGDPARPVKAQVDGTTLLDRVEYLLASRGDSDRPLFLYVHLMEAHAPWDPPDHLVPDADPSYAGPIDGSAGGHARLRSGAATPADARQAVALYDGELRRLDEALARLRELVARHLGDRPVVSVLTAPRATALGEAGRWGAAGGVDRALLLVPLVLDGVAPAGHAGQPVGLVDLMPTLLRLAGSHAPDDVDGIDLLALRDEHGRPQPPAGRALVAYDARAALPAGLGVNAAGALAVRRDGWRAERGAAGWSLVQEPGELDLAAREPQRLDELRAAAQAWEARGRQRQAGAPDPEPSSLGAAEHAWLEALGEWPR